MRVNRICLIAFATFLIVLGGAATAGEARRVESALAALRADLKGARVVRARIFSIPYSTFTTFTVTPDLLETHSRSRKIVVEMTPELIDGLIKSIDLVRVYGVYNDAVDLKWGAVFFGKDGARLHAIYLDGAYGIGRRANIGGINVELNESMLVWFENTFRTR